MGFSRMRVRASIIFIMLLMSVFTPSIVLKCVPSNGGWWKSDYSGGKARLYVNPLLVEKTVKDVCTTFQVNVTVENVTDLKAFDFNLTWDHNLITLVDVEFNTTLNDIWGLDGWFTAVNKTSLGYYKLAVVSISTSFNSTEPAPLATLMLHVEDVASGETPLHFDTAKLSDSEGEPIPVHICDGTYQIGPKLYFNPPLVEKAACDVCTTFKMNVTIKNFVDFFGFDLNITWNNTLITFTDVHYNETLDGIWGAGNWWVAINESGLGWYKLVASSLSSGYNTTEPAPLATLEFHVETPICNSVKETSIHFQTHKISNSSAQSIPHIAEDGTYRIIGKTPTLQMSPQGVTCHKHLENFTIRINVSHASNLKDFEFVIRYNTTLLDYKNVSWNAWQSGNVTVQEASGYITGSTAGTVKNGNLTLITTAFQTACHRIWKKCPDWTNILTGTVYLQRVNLSYPDAPNLRYERDVTNEIIVGPDFLYTFCPIHSDVDNDGDVDVFDLRTVAYYYEVEAGDPNWTEASKYDLNCDGVVNMTDLEIVEMNFWFPYKKKLPKAYFTFSPYTPRTNDAVTFNASESIPNCGRIENYEWNFDDDNQSQGMIVNHTYTRPGEYQVTLTVTDTMGLTSSFSKYLEVLPATFIDVYTQRNGRGLNESSDAFAPEERVKSTAYLIYNNYPVPDALVTFRLYSPNGTLIFSETNMTDDDGLASCTFSITSNAVFGIYSLNASASVGEEILSDIVRFRVGWLIEILDVTPCDQDGIPKEEFTHGEQLYLLVKLKNICFTPVNTTIDVSVKDELDQIIIFYQEEYILSPGQTTLILEIGTIPDEACCGEATAHTIAHKPDGPPYSLGISAEFKIVPP